MIPIHLKMEVWEPLNRFSKSSQDQNTQTKKDSTKQQQQGIGSPLVDQKQILI